MRRPFSTIVCFLLGVAASGTAVFAQAGNVSTTNADMMGALAAECALAIAPSPGPVRVTGLEAVPFMSSAVFTALVGSGFTVYDPGTAAQGLAQLGLTPEVLSVDYARADRHHVTRLIEVRLRVFVTNPDGTVLRDEACIRTAENRVAREAVPDLEDPAIPRTHAALPLEGGFLRRVVQPAVIGAATAAGVFLFFSLRSRRAGTGE